MAAQRVGGCKYEVVGVGGGELEELGELRRGPWTLEEDRLLIHYIACHGEGRWNMLARCSGLKRTGKSCRLRWLNYLKPDVKRGNLTPEEQILILELHSKWGNRWSRIAQHLPGRTDNEIKNYWRTRVQKQARQLRVDANSALFRDAVRCFWMPRLIEKMTAGAAATSSYNFPQASTVPSASHHQPSPTPSTLNRSTVPSQPSAGGAADGDLFSIAATAAMQLGDEASGYYVGDLMQQRFDGPHHHHQQYHGYDPYTQFPAEQPQATPADASHRDRVAIHSCYSSDAGSTAAAPNYAGFDYLQDLLLPRTLATAATSNPSGSDCSMIENRCSLDAMVERQQQWDITTDGMVQLGNLVEGGGGQWWCG